MLALLMSVLCSVGAPRDVDTVVVCPPAFVQALERWIAYRESQGHRIAVLDGTASAEEIRRGIRKLAASGSLRYVLLAGDADPLAETDATVRARSVPTHKALAKVNVRWGSEPELATDNWYADLDDDLLPDLAVGRVPADSAAELAAMLDRGIAYERFPPPGTWQRQVNFIAGAGGFGLVLDGILEIITRQFLTRGIPPEYSTSMTYGSWQSPFCPDPRAFHDATLARLNEGCLFWVYIGHSQTRHLQQVWVGDRAYHVLDERDVSKLQRSGGPPIALFLSCYTGAFDAPRDCLAETLLRSPHGPIAAYCGSRVTMPYAMAVMSSELMHEYFVTRRETLGELIQHSKRRMATSRTTDEGRVPDARDLLDTLAQAVYAEEKHLQEERLEHVLLFNLLGDPLMRLRHPQALALQLAEQTEAGRALIVSGETTVGGMLTVELVCRRDRTRSTLPRRKAPQDETDFAQYNDIYALANDRCWVTTTVRCEPGPFRIELSVPPDAHGPCHVSACLDGASGFALGSVPISVLPQRFTPVRIAELPDAEGEVTR